MSRSYDNRSNPSGPEYAPGKKSMRGPKRTGPIGSIVPGDHLEVAREIARLQDELRALRRHANTVVPPSSGGSADHMIMLWMGAGPPGSTGQWGGVWRVPELDGDSITVNLTLASVRFEDPGFGALDYAVRFEKSNGGGAFSATTITTVTVPSGDYEADDTSGLGSVTSGQLVRLYWTALGQGAGITTCTLEGDVA